MSNLIDLKWGLTHVGTQVFIMQFTLESIIKHLWHEVFKWTLCMWSLFSLTFTCEVFLVRLHMNLLWSLFRWCEGFTWSEILLLFLTICFLFPFLCPIWGMFFRQESLRAFLAHVTRSHEWSYKVSMCTKKPPEEKR